MRPHTLRRVLVSFAIVGVLASLGIQRVVGERGAPALPIPAVSFASSPGPQPVVALVPRVDPDAGRLLEQERESLRAVLMQPLPGSDPLAVVDGTELQVVQ